MRAKSAILENYQIFPYNKVPHESLLKHLLCEIYIFFYTKTTRTLRKLVDELTGTSW